MRPAALRLLFSLLAALLFASAAFAQSPGAKRVALVVGNSNYVSVTALANPGNDAKLMAVTLKAAGFKLVGGGAQLDLDKPHFDAAVLAFGRAIDGADVALFYYSGHGVQVGGVNYLVPVDSNPTRVQDLDFQMVSADLVLRQLASGNSKLNVVVLDACRNNPFGGRGLRGSNPGLAEMHAPEGTLISYATQPGNVASDGNGEDSPFTLALTEAMRTPGLDLLRLFNRVGLAVKKSTGGSQQPWLASSPLDGDFYFTAPVSTAPALALAAPAAPQPALPSQPAPQPRTAETAVPSPPTPPQRPGSAELEAAIQAGTGFHCPRAGLSSFVDGIQVDWRGADPVDADVCIGDSNGAPVRKLFGWYDPQSSGVRAAATALHAFFGGAEAAVSFQDGGDSIIWSHAGRGSVELGGKTMPADLLDMDITRTHPVIFLGKTTYNPVGRGIWHYYYDRHTGLFLRGIYERHEGPRRAEAPNWTAPAPPQ